MFQRFLTWLTAPKCSCGRNLTENISSTDCYYVCVSCERVYPIE